MTLVQIRESALALPGASEEAHFHLTSFRVRGKIFATAAPDGEFIHVFIREDEVDAVLAAAPDLVEKLFWGRRLAGIRIFLAGAAAGLVIPLLERAWARKAPPKLLAELALRHP